MDPLIHSIREHYEFVCLCDGSEDLGHISAAVVALMALVKKLIEVAAQSHDTLSVYKLSEGLVNAALKDITLQVK